MKTAVLQRFQCIRCGLYYLDDQDCDQDICPDCHEEEARRAPILAKQRAYRDRPDVKAKKRAYMQAYYDRPDVKAKKRAYMTAYHAAHKKEPA